MFVDGATEGNGNETIGAVNNGRTKYDNGRTKVKAEVADADVDGAHPWSRRHSDSTFLEPSWSHRGCQ